MKLHKRTLAAVLAGMLALGATACADDTGAPADDPAADPLITEDPAAGGATDDMMTDEMMTDEMMTDEPTE